MKFVCPPPPGAPLEVVTWASSPRELTLATGLIYPTPAHRAFTLPPQVVRPSLVFEASF